MSARLILHPFCLYANVLQSLIYTPIVFQSLIFTHIVFQSLIYTPIVLQSLIYTPIVFQSFIHVVPSSLSAYFPVVFVLLM